MMSHIPPCANANGAPPFSARWLPVAWEGSFAPGVFAVVTAPIPGLIEPDVEFDLYVLEHGRRTLLTHGSSRSVSEARRICEHLARGYLEAGALTADGDRQVVP